MTLDNFPLDHLHCTHKNHQKDQVQVKDLDLFHQDQLIMNNKPSIPDLSPPHVNGVFIFYLSPPICRRLALPR